MTADPGILRDLSGILRDLSEIRRDPALERGLQPPMPYSQCQRKPVLCLMMVSIGSYCFEGETDVVNTQCRGKQKIDKQREENEMSDSISLLLWVKQSRAIVRGTGAWLKTQ